MDFWGFVLSVVQSLIAAFIYDAWKSNRPAQPEYHSKNSDTESLSIAQSDADCRFTDDRRQRNRSVFVLFIKFLGTFYILYAAIHLPIMAKDFSANGSIYLDQARFFGKYLPHIPINDGFISAPSFAIAALLYFPMLYLAIAGARPIVWLLDNFIEVTQRTASVATILLFFLLCLLTAIIVIYIFYSVTIQEAMFSVIAVIFLTAGLSSSSRRR